MSALYRIAAIAFVAVSLTAAPRPALAEQITVTHWGVLMYGAPYAVAMEKGYYREAGLNIDGVLTSKGGGDAVRVVARTVTLTTLRRLDGERKAAVVRFDHDSPVVSLTGADLRRTAGEVSWWGGRPSRSSTGKYLVPSARRARPLVMVM